MSAKLRVAPAGTCLSSALLTLPCCSGASGGSCAAFAGDARLPSAGAALPVLPVLALPFALPWLGWRGPGCSSRLLDLGAAMVLAVDSLALPCPLAWASGWVPLPGFAGLGSFAWLAGADTEAGCRGALSLAFPAVLRFALRPPAACHSAFCSRGLR